MRPIAIAIAANLTTCGIAAPAGKIGFQALPLPAGPLFILFLLTAWAGGVFITWLWAAKATFDP